MNKEYRIKRKNNILMYLSGAIIGIVNGLFGGGGGMICVPLLKSIMHFNEKESHANALAIMLPVSMITSTVYMIRVQMPKGSISVIIGVIAGGIIGSICLSKINNKTLNIVFSIIMIIAGVRMICI